MQSMEHAKFTRTGTKVTDPSVGKIPEPGWLRDVLVLITINVGDNFANLKAKRAPRIYFDVDQIIYPDEELWERLEIGRNPVKRNQPPRPTAEQRVGVHGTLW